jgi:Cof subfamily protein (haloacid dehalogenase superfamily)
VIDVDGTLIGASGQVRPRVVQAIKKASDAGIAVALCTGRPLASCRPVIADLALAGPQIVFTGALVRDLGAERVVLRRSLPGSIAMQLVEFARKRELCLELYTEETHVVERDWLESRLHAISVRVTYEIGDLVDLIENNELIKAQLIVGEARAPEVVEELARELGNSVAISVATPMAPCEGLKCINVVDSGVSKGQAVMALVSHFGFARDQVVGFGDAPNDLEMFEAVGWRVAMGNADPVIRSLADQLCADVENDGLADAIEQILSAN